MLVSLFFPWFEPGLTAWSSFEMLDLLLAALSLGAVAAVASDPDGDSPLGRRSIPVLGAVALAVVGSQLIDLPPTVPQSGLAVGAWIGLTGAALMAAGGLAGLAGGGSGASVTDRIISGAGNRAPPSYRRERGEASPPDEAYAAESEVLEGLYPVPDRQGPIGADDPELATLQPEGKPLAPEDGPESTASQRTDPDGTP